MSSSGFRIVDGQSMYSAAWLDDAYEPSDPKHPSYAERVAEVADLERKARKESGLSERDRETLSRMAAARGCSPLADEPSRSESPPAGADTFKPPLACQARMPTPGNTWRYCKLPWNHKGGHVFD